MPHPDREILLRRGLNASEVIHFTKQSCQKLLFTEPIQERERERERERESERASERAKERGRER